MNHFFCKPLNPKNYFADAKLRCGPTENRRQRNRRRPENSMNGKAIKRWLGTVGRQWNDILRIPAHPPVTPPVSSGTSFLLFQIQIFGFNSQLYTNFSEALHKAQGIVVTSLLLQVRCFSRPIWCVSVRSGLGIRFSRGFVSVYVWFALTHRRAIQLNFFIAVTLFISNVLLINLYWSGSFLINWYI